MPATLDDFESMARDVQGLVMVSTLRADATIHTSLVNAGVLAHPLNGTRVVGFVTYGKVKLANLRARPQVTISVQSGWRWVAVEGRADIVGPDDPHDAVDADRLRLLLREVFAAAGGTHDDWDAYDRAMVEQRRCAVLVEVGRAYGN